ncbi:MAG: hypothetical protein KF699_12395 [Phycisphaeraceae bacterium]|nr:hypothetical protein [Phycisphaeraceae bacterium]
MPRTLLLPLLAALLVLPACAGPRADRAPVGAMLEDSTTARIPAGQYAAAFDCARRELRDAGFTLERVDAWSGVITTRPGTSAGFMTPWSGHQSTVAQELGDFAHRHQRIVRITFEPAEPRDADPGDLRAFDADLLMRTRVVVERVHVPHWRIDRSTIRHSSYATDPALVARGMQPSYAVPREEDPLLAARLTRRIIASDDRAHAETRADPSASH